MKFVFSVLVLSLLGFSSHASSSSPSTAPSRQARLSENEQTAADVMLRQVLTLHLLRGKHVYFNDDLRHALEGPDSGSQSTAHVAQMTCKRSHDVPALPGVGICTLFIRAFESEGLKNQSEVNYNLIIHTIGGHVATATITDYAG